MEFHRYELDSAGALNAVSTRTNFEGVILKSEGAYGVLHPWPEFGDPSLEAQLELLRDGKSSRAIERALHMMEVDGAARKNGRYLLQEGKIPRCHYSWNHHASFDSQMELLKGESWLAVKSKGFPDLDRMLAWLRKFHDATLGVALGLRLDFNSTLSKESFIDLLEAMGEEMRSRLDFVEDPFAYDASEWSEIKEKYGIQLALDKKLAEGTSGFDVAIFKPARREWRTLAETLPKQVRVVFTSAMDHGFAQAFAAWEAMEATKTFGERIDLCGLSTQHLFEKDPFFDQIQVKGGWLTFDHDPEDVGFGFNRALENLEWHNFAG